MTEGAGGRAVLARARRQAEDLGLDRLFVVDADAHHFETESWSEIVEYVPDRVLRNFGRNPRPGRPSLLPQALGTTDTAGRLLRDRPQVDGAGHADAAATRAAMDAIGIDVALVVPTAMQFLGLHPQPEVESNLARAYNRWLVERVIPGEARIRPFLYLPLNIPEACAPVIEEFGEIPGIAGFLVASARYRAIHDNAYMRAYAMLEERGLPLAFHAAHNWQDPLTSRANRFLGVYATGLPQFNAMHMTNWLVNGLPERFPNLRLIWMEAGLAWLPFLMQRLDSAFAMRPSEAPSLKRPPSEYMREMFYTSHPLEITGETDALAFAFSMIRAESQLMWASGYPQWNFDVPASLFDLDFLDDTARRNILGETARRVFGLGPPRREERLAIGAA